MSQAERAVDEVLVVISGEGAHSERRRNAHSEGNRRRDSVILCRTGRQETSTVGLVYEGGICLTLICTIKELLIFT